MDIEDRRIKLDLLHGYKNQDFKIIISYKFIINLLFTFSYYHK